MGRYSCSESAQLTRAGAKCCSINSPSSWPAATAAATSGWVGHVAAESSCRGNSSKTDACSDLDGRDKQFFVQEDLRTRPQRRALDGDMTLDNGQARGAVVRPLDLVEGNVWRVLAMELAQMRLWLIGTGGNTKGRTVAGPLCIIFFCPASLAFCPQNALFAQTPSFFAQPSTYASARTSPRISGISDWVIAAFEMEGKRT